MINPCRKCRRQPSLSNVGAHDGNRVHVAMCKPCDRVNLGASPSKACEHWNRDNPIGACSANVCKAPVLRDGYCEWHAGHLEGMGVAS
jgi:hypothetical protein